MSDWFLASQLNLLFLDFRQCSVTSFEQISFENYLIHFTFQINAWSGYDTYLPHCSRANSRISLFLSLSFFLSFFLSLSLFLSLFLSFSLSLSFFSSFIGCEQKSLEAGTRRVKSPLPLFNLYNLKWGKETQILEGRKEGREGERKRGREGGRNTEPAKNALSH